VVYKNKALVESIPNPLTVLDEDVVSFILILEEPTEEEH
jgi:hypothetical protein